MHLLADDLRMILADVFPPPQTLAVVARMSSVIRYHLNGTGLSAGVPLNSRQRPRPKDRYLEGSRQYILQTHSCSAGQVCPQEFNVQFVIKKEKVNLTASVILLH